MKKILVQAYLRDFVGLIPDHHNKAHHNLFADGGSCLQFAKNTISVKCNNAKHNKTRYACTFNYPAPKCGLGAL